MKKICVVLFLAFIGGCDNNFVGTKEEDANQKILFYGFNILNSDSTSIYILDLSSNEIEEVARYSSRSYPTWFEYPQSILFLNNPDSIQHDLVIQNVISGAGKLEIVKENVGNILFLRYSKDREAVLFSFKDYYDFNRIAYYDFITQQAVDYPIINFDSRNPVWSEKDDWIYFTGSVNSSFNIYRIKKEGNILESFFIDDNFDITTFDIDKKSELLVASRYNSNNSFITVYNMKSRTILYNVELSDLGMGLYPSFTSDSKKILFVNGIPNNYSAPRNIFIMNIDGTDRKQLTFSENSIYSRPLNW